MIVVQVGSMVEDLTAANMGCLSAAIFDTSELLHLQLMAEVGLAAVVTLTLVATMLLAAHDLQVQHL